jgi:RHH-type proline utilization regulon transcriptional repressor/proline dehydrogenase/delta 1-pyrroline-5-carboxylate dehydrogenase
LTSADGVELVLSPHDRQHRVGTVCTADAAAIEGAIAGAHASGHDWDRLGGAERAQVLDRAADLYERDRVRLMAVMVREAGKTVENALGDVREAVDFLRYYAAQARRLFAGPISLRGPTGETNLLELRGAGRSPASRPGTFRSPSSRARWQRPWQRATRCSPSPPSRHRSRLS